MKVVFMGTPEFAVPSLDMLVKEGYEVDAVVTQPDKPKGRGNKLSFPPVKEYALSNDIKVIQPDKVRTSEFINELKSISPDLLVTVAYGKILPKEVLDIPTYGCINVHGSLLPKYRGAGPLQWAIINGEEKTGITTMYTDVGMDTGDMLLKSEITITEDMTASKLHDEMALMGAEVLKETLIKLLKNELVRTPQPDNEATYAPMINKELGKIDWEKLNKEIHNLVRGTNPWPGAYAFYKGGKMKIWKTEIIDRKNNDLQPGTIINVSSEGLIVACKQGCISVTEVQFESSKRMSVGDYIRGHMINEGEILE